VQKTTARARAALPEISILFVAGTPEAGGWTTREVKRIIRGLAGLNFVYVRNLSSKPRTFLTNVNFHHPVAQTSSKLHPHTITLTSRASPQLTSYTTFSRSSYRVNRRSHEMVISRGGSSSEVS